MPAVAEDCADRLSYLPWSIPPPNFLRTATEVSFEEGITERPVSGETIRALLARLGVRWELSLSARSRAPILNMPAKRGLRSADTTRPELSSMGFTLRERDLGFLRKSPETS